ncbi:hypothetical protein C4546_03450 [Candidatus Parcubacteria bacterium]|jgi:capsular polysaccharide biosynthesis protein|nr:MAG: hypothetical protein C4546_03450 [Candidatus Parcubacteria bacterium]
MQLLASIKILGKYWLLFAFIILVPIAAALVFAATRPDKYTTSIAFTVNRINKQSTAEYQFDGYYALQASDLFSDTVVSWFLTPSVIVEMYDHAGLNPQVESLSSLTSRFKIKKYSSQNLVVKFSSDSPSSAEKLAQAVIDTVEAKSAQLNQSADRKALFEVIGSKPVTVKDSKQLPLVGFVGLVIGGFLAVLVFGLLRVLLPAYRQRSFEV